MNHIETLHFNKYIELLIKILNKYSQYAEYKVVRDTETGFIINFYNVETNEKELQAIAETKNNKVVVYTKKDNFKGGKEIKI